MSRRASRGSSRNRRGSPSTIDWMPAWLLPALIVCIAAFQLYAFHWGVITPDTVFQWKQALAGRYDDWHPPVTAWLWRQLMPLGPGTAPVLVFDVLLYWAGAGLFAETLRRRGHGVAAAMVMLVAASPIPLGQLGAILKDPLLAASCLLAAALLFAGREARSPARWAAFILSFALLVFASAVRINALVATAPLLAAWLPDAWLARPLRAAMGLVAAVVVLAAGNWAINSVALHPNRSQPINSVINFDLAGIVASGGINGYPSLDDSGARAMAARCYRPAQFNRPGYPDCDAVEEALVDYAEAHHVGTPGLWAHAVAASPLAYAEHRLRHLNENWRFMVKAVPDDAVYVMSEPNDLGLQFRSNAASLAVWRAAVAVARSPLGRPATWIAVALGLLIAGGGGRSRAVVVGLALSALFYGGAYLFASVAPDLRYNLWTMLAAALALIVWSATLSEASVRWPRLLAGALPVVLTIAAELSVS